MNSIEKITSPILVVTFHGNPEPTLISYYSPTNIADEQEAIDFYNDLSSLIRSVPKHNILIIGGDLMQKLYKTYTINSRIILHLIEMVNT